MNKKFMSFVLAMVLSVGLGVSAFASTNETSSRGSSGVMRQSGNQVTATSSLVDRITTVFHYEHGMITSATGADGTVSLYDRGQFRMSLTLGLNGEYSISSFVAYGTDYAEIEAAGGLENWLKKWGVTDEQLEGGGSPRQEVAIDKSRYEKMSKSDPDHYIAKEENKKDKNGNDITDEFGNPEKVTNYYRVKDAKDAEDVKWMGKAMGHLAGGINKSISINFNATDGASLTLNTNGKAFETYAWDGELISTNTYFVATDGQNGVVTRQAEMDLVQIDGSAVPTDREDIAQEYAENPDQFQKAWSRTVTKGGKVVSCVNDANPTQELRRYDYNADGSINRILDYANGTVTFITTTGQVTLSALDGTNLYTTSNAELDAMFSKIFTYSKEKDDNGNYIYKFNDEVVTEDKYGDLLRSEGFRVASVIAYNKNGTYNYSVNIDDSGKTTTTAYIANKQVASGNGWKSPDYLRDRANAQYDFALNGGNPSSVGDDTVTVFWYADQLRDIAADPAKLDRFIITMGWDVQGTDIDSNGNVVTNRQEALDMITDALNFSSGNGSPAISLTYSNTTYSQADLDKLAEDNKENLPKNYKMANIPSGRYVSSATVYHHNAQSYQLNFADKDPSLSRASYITAASIFKPGVLGDLNQYSSIGQFEARMEEIASEIENEVSTRIDALSDQIDNDTVNRSDEADEARYQAKADAITKSIARKYFKDADKMKLNIEINSAKTETNGEHVVGADIGNWTTTVTTTTKRNGDNIKEAFSDLLKTTAGYVRKLTGLVRAGGAAGVAQLNDYIGNQLVVDAAIKKDVNVHTEIAKDPAVVGKATYDPATQTLTYGPGTRVYLQDGSGESYVLKEGETLVVDVSDLSDDAKAKLKTACENGEEVMTMGEAGAIETKENGDKVIHMTAKDDANFGYGYATGDRLKDVEKALKAGGGDVVKDANGNDLDWIAQNTAQNVNGALKNAERTENGALKDWLDGWYRLANF